MKIAYAIKKQEERVSNLALSLSLAITGTGPRAFVTTYRLREARQNLNRVQEDIKQASQNLRSLRREVTKLEALRTKRENGIVAI